MSNEQQPPEAFPLGIPVPEPTQAERVDSVPGRPPWHEPYPLSEAAADQHERATSELQRRLNLALATVISLQEENAQLRARLREFIFRPISVDGGNAIQKTLDDSRG